MFNRRNLLIFLFLLLPSNTIGGDQVLEIGWREWVELPEFKISKIKTKVDTGARTSSIHATLIYYFTKNGESYVRFYIQPVQGSDQVKNFVIAKVLERRKVKSSNGLIELRPVIQTKVKLMGKSFLIELTLADRTDMGFRMLLGREALKNRFIVNPAKSFLNNVAIGSNK